MKVAVKGLLNQTVSQWFKDEAPRMGAALAFYTVFSMAPILIVAIAVAGMVFGQQAAQNQIVGQIQELIGRQSAETVQALIEASVRPFASGAAAIVGVITLLIGSTGALVELQWGLNRVWRVKTKSNVLSLIKDRLISLALVAGIAFLLLVSLIISATLAAVGTLWSHGISAQEAGWHGLDFLLSCAVITALFAMIFKTLPEAYIRWTDVWIGAAVTATLFTAGKFLVGIYIGKGALTSTFGAAGSFVAILTWVYYSALVLYFGAEFTKAYADRYGSRRNSPKEEPLQL